MNKLINWLYTTWLGNLYFETLLWLDRRDEKKNLRLLSPKEASQIIKQYSLLGDGVKEIKDKVNSLIATKTKEEYNKILKEIDNIISLAERQANDPKSQFVNFLKSNVDFSNKDIKNTTDRAKMVNKRINDMYELQEDKLKRQLIREIRKANQEGDKIKLSQLQMEFKEKYGTRRN